MILSSHCAVPTSHVIVLLSYSMFPLFFFSHFMIPSSHYVVPRSHVIVFLSHSVVPLFFSHIWWYYPYIAQYQHHMWLYFCHIRWFPYFFLTFYGTILTLHSINITCDYTFVKFDGSFFFFFFHILWYHSHIAQYQYHMWLYFCHIRWFLYFFLHFMIPTRDGNFYLTCGYTAWSNPNGPSFTQSD